MLMLPPINLSDSNPYPDKYSDALKLGVNRLSGIKRASVTLSFRG